MRARARPGFTLVELLVALVLGSFLVLVIYQVLITNSRTYALSSARIQGRQMLRAGIGVLVGELREISSQSGDLVEMQDDQLTIRAQRAFGLVCAVDYTVSPPTLTVVRLGPAFEVGDSVFVLHDNDPERDLDDKWLGGVATAVDTTTTCGSSPGQTLTVPFVGTTAAATPPDSVRSGAPVRGFDIFTYAQYEIGGEPYLGRQLGGIPSPYPLVGPLHESGGVAFRYLDTLGAVTTVDSLVAQIEVTLRYRSEVLNLGGELVSDSILVRVYPRN